jgi:sec-independent protein translocase protein TatA
MSRRNFFVLTILQVVGLLHRSQCSAFVVRHALLDTTSHHQASWTKGQQKYLSPAAYQPPLARNNQNAVKSYNHVLPRQRRSVASIQTMGLFGLGAAEIAVILIVVVFVLGPNQIGKMTGNFAGRFKGEYDGLPDELKKIPEEFQKGYDESTVNARARNAKKMEKVPEEDKPDE